MGKQVKILVNTKVAAGIYNIQWNVNDEKGQAVPAGVYFLTLNSDGKEFNKKIIKQ